MRMSCLFVFIRNVAKILCFDFLEIIVLLLLFYVHMLFVCYLYAISLSMLLILTFFFLPPYRKQAINNYL